MSPFLLYSLAYLLISVLLFGLFHFNENISASELWAYLLGPLGALEYLGSKFLFMGGLVIYLAGSAVHLAIMYFLFQSVYSWLMGLLAVAAWLLFGWMLIQMVMSV